MDSFQDNTEGGIAYPLNSKRLKLRHVQHLASNLNLPTTATRSDLEVMISGKLAETNHDATNIQVVLTQSEEGEQLSLKDMDGTFLVTPILPYLVSESPTPQLHEGSDYEGEVGSFTAEVTQLQNILQMFEGEAEFLRTELRSTKQEVEQLRAELSRVNERVVELWQENCKQLLDHDAVMAEKEKEMQLVREQLQVRELELARLKLLSLKEVPVPISISDIKASSPAMSLKHSEHVVGESTIIPTKRNLAEIPKDDASTSFVKDGDEKVVVPKISLHPKVTTLQVSTEQQGRLTSTTPDLLTSKHVYAHASNPFQGGGDVTNPAQRVVEALPAVTQSSGMNKIPYVSQAQSGRFERPQLGRTSQQGLTSQIQPNQQVTQLSTSLSDTLFTSRPISSVGTANYGKLTTEG